MESNDTFHKVDGELKSLGVPVEKLADTERAYPQHVLDGFSQGALLDLRVRFAMQLLTQSPIFHGIATSAEAKENAGDIPVPTALAAMALDLATELLKLADARCLVQPIDDTAALPESLGVQAGRMGAFEAYKQIGAQAAMQAARGSVVPVAPGIIPRGH